MWELDHTEGWALKNWCFQTVVLEKTLESPLDCKHIKPVSPKGNQPWIFHWKDLCWSWSSSTLATWCEERTRWKRPRCWERLKAGGKGDDRGWDGWMASLTQWTWTWANSGRWWGSEEPVSRWLNEKVVWNLFLKCQMETLELENRFIEIKNSVNAFNRRWDQTKESINILKK